MKLCGKFHIPCKWCKSVKVEKGSNKPPEYENMSKRIKYIILETTNLLSPYWLHSQGDNGFGYIDSHRFCAKTDHLIKWKNRKAKFEQLWTCVKKFNLFLFKVHNRKKTHFTTFET